MSSRLAFRSSTPLKDNTPARDVPQLFYQLRKKISDIKDDLPAGLIGPSINDEYGDVDSILYMITSDGADYAQMKKVAEAFRQRLLKVKNVIKVNLYGTQDEKIYVEFSNVKLATLGITTDQLFQSLARQNAVVPAGAKRTSHRHRRRSSADPNPRKSRATRYCSLATP